MAPKSGIPEIEAQVLQVVKENWPISALEIAKRLGEGANSREQKKRGSTKYAYYLKKLVNKRHLLSKRVGNALVVWPLEVEAYRAIHRILKDAEAP